MRTKILSILCLWRSIWGYLAVFFCPKYDRKRILEEQNYWNTNIVHENGLSGLLLFSRLVRFYPEYVNLYLYRLGGSNTMARIFGSFGMLFFKKEKTLYITTPKIGWNLIIQHGFSTVITAKSIGENCWINQQVTIGYSFDNEPPTIGNGCRISAGAKVIGSVKLEDNSIVGANAVVTHDVLENEIVGGVPAKVIGKNVQHKLYNN